MRPQHIPNLLYSGNHEGRDDNKVPLVLKIALYSLMSLTRTPLRTHTIGSQSTFSRRMRRARIPITTERPGKI